MKLVVVYPFIGLSLIIKQYDKIIIRLSLHTGCLMGNLIRMSLYTGV